MKIEELIKLPEVGYRLAEANLNLVKEGPDIATELSPCCPIPDFKFLKAPAWEITKYCKTCNRLVMVFPQDRMGGSYQDPWQVYENPTEENPLLSFEVHNHFIDFCTTVNPYGRSYSNVYQLSGDYKRYMRLLKKTGKPDLVPLFPRLSRDKIGEFLKFNIISDYDKCRELLEGLNIAEV